LPYQANAQVPAGPFQNQSELVAAWQQLYDTYRVASHATLDGVSVFRKSGFGPALNGRYYVCPNDYLIRQSCPQDGPFSWVSDITAYWSQPGTSMGAATFIYVEGQLVYQRGGFGPALVKHYVYCSNRGGVYMTNCWL
jgi:hypothetical protein